MSFTPVSSSGPSEQVTETVDQNGQSLDSTLSSPEANEENQQIEPMAAITPSMKEAEKEAVEKGNTDFRVLKRKAEAEYAALTEDTQRHHRLHFLLERSALYSKFLMEKLEVQQKQAQAKEAKAREAEQQVSSTVQTDPIHPKDNETQSPPRRSSRSSLKRPASPDPSSDSQTPASTKAKSSKKEADSKKKKTKESTYSIASYLDPQTIERAKEAHAKGSEGMDDKAESNPPLSSSSSSSSSSTKPSPSVRQPSLITGGIMRDYQLAGMEWLISLYENGLNGILADEMGLGKTLQTIAFLSHLREMGVWGPFLIAAPLSTLANWVCEFQRFTPSIPVCLYHGSKDERQHLRTRRIGRKALQSPDASTKFPIVVTSYEIVMNDRKYLQHINWKYIVVDEGHRLKNLNCRLIRELKSYNSANRLLLSGTPLQNNLAELWSLLNFLLPDIFDDLDSFQQWFDFSDMKEEEGRKRLLDGDAVVAKLHQILRPFLLRRIKSDVESSLPKKREYVLYAPVTPAQRELYDAIVRRDIRGWLEKKNSTTTSSSSSSTDNEPGKVDPRFKGLRLQNVFMQLRKACNHPWLFEVEYPEVEKSLAKGALPQVVALSGKMRLLDQLVPRLFEAGHKILIFSQMTKVLDILEIWALSPGRSWPYCRIDGMTPQDERRRMIQAFNAPQSPIPLFLLSTRSGGLGINLTAADTVILFDSDWNPQADLQAQDRVHRIGQKRPVIVYRIVTGEKTVEARVIERAREKRKLEKMVIHKGAFREKGRPSSSEGPTESQGEGQGGEKGGSSKPTTGSGMWSEALQQEIEDILAGKDESIHSIGQGDHRMIDILSEADLARIMDRSDEAYEREAKAAQVGGDGAVLPMEDRVDEKNDTLAGIQSTLTKETSS
ncbi:MAG: SNF2 family N-terminal domain-containing protein [Piptocephalis tieghemiana]|nr:MAG: SNF2 family N-terminal domain-containing protein [Piptocephalis tieghemiana]